MRGRQSSVNARRTRSDGHRNRPDWRRVFRVAGWNIALLAAGLALIAAAAEIYLRVTQPFASRSVPRHFVPEVGYVYAPGAEIRYTNYADFWTVSRVNRLGFADRDPIDPAHTKASCHVTLIGDSFVAALEVPVADKLQVRLETLARRELPLLDITTSAFGHTGYAPVNELAFYDQYARHLRPRMLVLVLVPNDLWGNSPLLQGLASGWDPDHLPFVSAGRTADGTRKLLPPDPTHTFRKEHFRRAVRLLDSSYAQAWLRYRFSDRWPRLWTALVQTLLGLSPAPSDIPPRKQWDAVVRAPVLPPAFQEALALLGFALDQFVERTRRDGVELVILAIYELGGRGNRAFDRLHALAAARGIPVVDQHDYIVSRGGDVRDAHWPRDGHWSPAGHQWAAEALLEYLRRRPEICSPRA